MRLHHSQHRLLQSISNNQRIKKKMMKERKQKQNKKGMMNGTGTHTMMMIWHYLLVTPYTSRCTYGYQMELETISFFLKISFLGLNYVDWYY